MEGLLDFRLREILTKIGGYDECVSEFIRVNDTLLPPHRIYRDVPELHHNSRTLSDFPVKIQLLGSDINCMTENASMVATLGAYGIDLNFGCPAPTVNRNRGGAALLKEPMSWNDTKGILQQYWKKLELNMDTTSRGVRIKQWLHYLSRQFLEAEKDFEIVKRFKNIDEIETYWKDHK